MSLEKNDEQVIMSFKNGDREAFKELINRYTSSMFNFSARLAGRNEAPDIVQEIFIKVWKNISRFDSKKASFKTWIFTIAKNTATDFLRKKKDYVFSDMEGAEDEDPFYQKIPDEKILPDESFQKLEDKKMLETTLEKLRPSYREILVLHYQEEMTFDEISKILKKPLNTVKSQHRRAIIELQKIIND
jgi:RNA polymerase sigma-70 factor (ECF subfamily)